MAAVPSLPSALAVPTVGETVSAAALAAPAPRLRVQTGSLEASGPQSRFAVVGAGTGSPVAYNSWTGQFSGPVSSALLDADPFSDRLLDVAAGDLVTFVIAVQNVTPGTPAWDVVLRDTPPAGFVVPVGGADLNVLTGAGEPLAATGDLFDPAGGLRLDPAAPLAGYDADSGENVALVVFTLQATSAMPAPSATLRNTAAVVHLAGSSGGADLAAADAAALTATTDVVGLSQSVAITLTGTGSAATPGSQLAVGETATFHATVTLPPGQSAGLRIGAAVPAGLVLVSETVTYATPGMTGLWIGEASTSGFSLGTLQAGSAITVGLDIVVRASGTLAAGTVQEVVSAADPAGTGRRVSTSAGAPVSVLAPALSLIVDGPARVQAGQAATYVVRLANAAGAAPAYGVRLTNALPAGLTAVPGSVQASGAAAGVALGTAAGGGLVADAERLNPGETLVLTLQARAAAAPGTALTQSVRATAASLAGGSPAYQLAPLLAGSTTTVTAPTATLTLSSPAARVGQVVTLQVQAALPEGDNPAVRVVATLPDGLVLVPGSVAATGGAGGAAVTAAGSQVEVGLGAVTAPAGGGTVTVRLQAQVGAVPVGAGLTGRAVVDTGYGVSPAASATVQVADTPPVLAGLAPEVGTVDDTAASPFAAAALTDPDAGQTLSARVLLQPADGALVALAGGTYDAGSGRYDVSGTADVVEAALRGLLYLPAPHRLAYGASRASDLALQVSDGAGGVANAAVRVIAAGANSPPTLAGAAAGRTTVTLAAQPFAGLLLADADAGQVETLTVQAAPGLGALKGTLGDYDPAAGAYVAHGTVDALQADARALVFTPAAPGVAAFAVTLDDGAGGVAQDGGTTLLVQPTSDAAGVAQHFPQQPGAAFLAYAGGALTRLVGEAYHGPVDYLRTQLIYDSAEPAVIVAEADDAFIKSFSGFCAIQVAGGRNVVDAGPGSNFLVGGTGDDTFFLAGNPDVVTWDTIQGFHPGDMMTLFGFHAGVSSYTWADADGAAGYTGRTIHADLTGGGGVTASLTFAGMTAADMERWVITAGTVGTVDYLAVLAL